MASKMDSLNIEWRRPDPIKWIDKNQKQRHYFPDFFLPEYNLYVDPKNPMAYNAQIEKIDCLKLQLQNLIILKSIKEIDDFLETLKPPC